RSCSRTARAADDDPDSPIPTSFLARDRRRSSHCDAASITLYTLSLRLLFADAIRAESRLNYRALRRQRKEKMLAFYFRASDDGDLPAREIGCWMTPLARWERRGGRWQCSGSR